MRNMSITNLESNCLCYIYLICLFHGVCYHEHLSCLMVNMAGCFIYKINPCIYGSRERERESERERDVNIMHNVDISSNAFGKCGYHYKPFH